ncbi:phytoene desaturase family protein [Cellulomonas bogoriensis]|uniref:Phytoene dehydrogenase n=1 Tax=Cellulomonas bogoriensis 69B4 = DSM 16987 TaxID=1386082 RepID=A0A0A0C3Y7_9CELL|nr:NAD(P)/FAD-dependent oxidoreductase [Cellulomonas bogoriensis]KGM14094.1 phytoene dehydrogenase [Cellulomonas bogoriensis 69B4 = DSM 16987]
MSQDVDVVVVGSGPNGLAAAVTLARSGLSVHVIEAEDTAGGGARTVEGLVPGVVHDLCSAVHPMALASPFFRRFDLRARGVRLATPEVSYAQPLPGGRAALAFRDLGRTVAELGPDGPAWDRLMGPLVEHVDGIVSLVMGDYRHVPRDLVQAARFGLRTLEQGWGPTWDRRFSGDEAPALLTGVAAHAIIPMPSVASAGTAMLLGALAHGTGWSLPRGGTQVITDALVQDLLEHGGRLTTGVTVTGPGDLPRSRAVVLDTTPGAAARILQGRLPDRLARRLRGFPHGNGAAKVDLVLSGPVPWSGPGVGAAGTVHLGGTRQDMVRTEQEVSRGRHPQDPMVLLSDPAVSDATRIGPGGVRPLWAYTHVPRGSTRDMTEAVVARIERDAPGFRDLVVEARCVPAARMSDHNANYVGGDISTGAITLRRMLLGPTGRWDPYRLGTTGAYLCSASAPPGPGVHGMGGWHAARRVLADRFGITAPPDLSPTSGPAGPRSA